MERTEPDDEDRLRLAEDVVGGVEPSERWWAAWTAEANRRYERLISGDDPGLTSDEFWSDED